MDSGSHTFIRSMWLETPDVQRQERTAVKDFTPAAKLALTKETNDFLVNTLLDSGTFEHLLTADYTYADKSLEWLYGGTSTIANEW